MVSPLLIGLAAFIVICIILYFTNLTCGLGIGYKCNKVPVPPPYTSEQQAMVDSLWCKGPCTV